MSKSLIEINSENKSLVNALNVKNALIIPTIIFGVGFIVAFLGYPLAISVCCLITIVRSILYTLK